RPRLPSPNTRREDRAVLRTTSSAVVIEGGASNRNTGGCDRPGRRVARPRAALLGGLQRKRSAAQPAEEPGFNCTILQDPARVEETMSCGQNVAGRVKRQPSKQKKAVPLRKHCPSPT